MAETPYIAIIGPGKVGTAIGVLAGRAGLPVVALAGGSRSSAEAAARRIGPEVRVCAADEAAGAGRLVLLTVPDEKIQPLCEQLAEAGAFAPGSVVAHCCGALGGEILSSARTRCRCAVGSMHPLQTFPTVQAALDKLPGTYFFCEGDEQAVTALEGLARALGGKPLRIGAGGKALYHAAAVMACNYLTGLLDAALELCARAGIDRAAALAALEPLIRATVDNVAAMGPQEALTGPIARGDVETVRRHVEALGACPADLAELYRAAGKWTAGLARRKGTIDDAAAGALRRLLDRKDGKE